VSNIDQKKGKLKTVFGGMAIMAGIGLILFGLPDFSKPSFNYAKLAELKPGQPGFPELHGAYPAESVSQYRIKRESASLDIQVAQYQKTASTIIYPPADNTEKEANLRYELWQAAALAIRKHSNQEALFLSWWDNGQRIRFMSGRKPWLDKPISAAFPDKGQQTFWRQVSGGFDKDETRLKQLARWLSMDADAALVEMDQILTKGQDIYWLLCLDDLARLSEIEALSGVKLPFEARVFPPADNIHAQIAEVRRWAGETGVGSYLVQQLPSGGARVWRITSEDGVKTLLARLLPFTSSLAKPLDRQTLVYQSGWGGYLSVYQWQR
jgi:hydroxylamine oxidation protein HaoB